MNILLTGVETNNKGAELMLYAILHQIELICPSANVFIHRHRIIQGRNYILSNLNIILYRSSLLYAIMNRMHIDNLVYKYNIDKFLPSNTPYKDLDYYLDGSGLLFSDQMDLSGNRLQKLERSLRSMTRMGAKIVYLPQAFGPIQKETTKRAISILSRYANMINARDEISYNYLRDSKLVDIHKTEY